MAGVEQEELVDYEEEPEETTADGKDVVAEGGQKRGNYVAIHASGFRDFFLKPELLRAIGDAGFEHPSEVQHECIPQAITGTDILCQAKSGMGKTAVFVISILQQLNANESAVLCVVMGHTRELAYQIKNEFDRFSKYLSNVRISVVYGGTPQENDEKMLASDDTRPHIMIGTPGRMLSLARTKKMDLSKCRYFVLDECDKCLEKEDMREDVLKIYMMMPKKVQVLMFSATMEKSIREVCKKFMNDPLEIFVDNEGKLTLHGLLQHYVKLTEQEKNRKLNDILDKLEFNQVIIFVKSPQRAKVLNNLLNECNFPSICIYGNMPQEERIKQYREFKQFKARIMVATDLFGRGIDIERVNIVVNYDMPDASDSYLHRVGRAGRFGTKGLAITFSSTDEDAKILEEVQKRFEVHITEMPETIDTSQYINA